MSSGLTSKRSAKLCISRRFSKKPFTFRDVPPDKATHRYNIVSVDATGRIAKTGGLDDRGGLNPSECHKSVIAFGSKRCKTNQKQSTRGFRKRLTRQNIIRNFQNQSKRTSEPDDQRTELINKSNDLLSCRILGMLLVSSDGGCQHNIASVIKVS